MADHAPVGARRAGDIDPSLSDEMLLERLRFAEYAATHRDCEIVLWINLQLDEPVAAWIRIPRKRIAERMARREPPPFWQHGCVVRVTPGARRNA